MDKRTSVQLEFDMAKHGWAFCNNDMLHGKLIQLREIAKRLPVGDRRHDVLDYIEKTFKAN